MDKPKYPKVLMAYTQTMEQDIFLEEQVVFNETDEAEFKRIFATKNNIVKERPLNNDEIKSLPIAARISYVTPKWVYVACGGIGVIIGAVGVEVIKKALGLC